MHVKAHEYLLILAEISNDWQNHCAKSPKELRQRTCQNPGYVKQNICLHWLMQFLEKPKGRMKVFKGPTVHLDQRRVCFVNILALTLIDPRGGPPPINFFVIAPTIIIFSSQDFLTFPQLKNGVYWHWFWRVCCSSSSTASWRHPEDFLFIGINLLFHHNKVLVTTWKVT